MAGCDRTGDRTGGRPGDRPGPPSIPPVTSMPQGVRGVVPLEAGPHRRCWMAWPSSRAIWGNLLPGIQHDIALVASTIARFEPVTLCANADQVATARDACGRGVEVVGDVPVDDCWMRDSGPIFTLEDQRSLGAVGLNFNGWGERQIHDRDAEVAERVAALAAAPFRRADLVAEGGAIETDGAGTLLATESSVVNDNRNPGRTTPQLEDALFDAYGADRDPMGARYCATETSPTTTSTRRRGSSSRVACSSSCRRRPAPTPGPKTPGSSTTCCRSHRRPRRRARSRRAPWTSGRSTPRPRLPRFLRQLLPGERGGRSRRGSAMPRPTARPLACSDGCSPAGRSCSSTSTVSTEEAAASIASPSRNPWSDHGSIWNVKAYSAPPWRDRMSIVPRALR